MTEAHLPTKVSVPQVVYMSSSIAREPAPLKGRSKISSVHCVGKPKNSNTGAINCDTASETPVALNSLTQSIIVIRKGNTSVIRFTAERLPSIKCEYGSFFLNSDTVRTITNIIGTT